MKQKRKAAEKIQRLANTNFTTKESRLTFSYEKEGFGENSKVNEIKTEQQIQAVSHSL